MPIPSGYSRSTFYGHLEGGDIFNMSLWANEAPLDNAATQTQANAFRDAFNAKNSNVFSPTHYIRSGSGYDGVRVYSYTDTTGKAAHIGDASIAKPGTAGSTGLLPQQVALCVSLLTAQAGRSAKGRIYMPLMVLALGFGGQADSPTVDGVAAWWATFITALNTAIGGPAKIGVLSQKHGTFQPITAVAVDTRLDIQRRRANRENVTYRNVTAVL